ncbi:hypothetical protein BHM03_00045940 [Ensete ventricosum]|nr:hypothetical protein BHM03_00045940 [Ensete ventricosum]
MVEPAHVWLAWRSTVSVAQVQLTWHRYDQPCTDCTSIEGTDLIVEGVTLDTPPRHGLCAKIFDRPEMNPKANITNLSESQERTTSDFPKLCSLLLSEANVDELAYTGRT